MPLVKNQSFNENEISTDNDHVLKYGLALSKPQKLSRIGLRKTRFFSAMTLTAATLAVTACGGSSGSNDASLNSPPASTAQATLSYRAAKGFRFSWSEVPGATYYQILENLDGNSGFSPVGERVNAGNESPSETIIVPLYKRLNARYIVQSCNDFGCTDSTEISVSGNLVDGIGFIKADNYDEDDAFGKSVALSGDGMTLAVGAEGEDGAGNLVRQSGAVYIFVRNDIDWTQQAYLKASNAAADDFFGRSVSLSNDGNTLAVGAGEEDSSATGVNGDQTLDDALQAGAAYVFVRSGTSWTQQAYVKASNTDGSDVFGRTVELSGDGNTLAVSAEGEDSSGTNVNGTSQGNNAARNSGAVYTFLRNGSAWSQQAYIKASNTETTDAFGVSIDFNDAGDTLAISALLEDGSATGAGGDQTLNNAPNSGAVYVYALNNSVWRLQAYLKASNTGSDDQFGRSVSLSGNGNVLAVGAANEDSNGVNGGASTDNTLTNSGAVYVFERTASFGLGTTPNFTWSQQAFLKSSNAEGGDLFGFAVDLSSDGNTLVVSAPNEDSDARGLGGNDGNGVSNSGAAYVFNRNSNSAPWSQQAYVKASNTQDSSGFGESLSISNDGKTLAIGANQEGIDGITEDDSGAVYLY